MFARAGEVHNYGIDLDAERTSAARMGEDMSTNANNGGGTMWGRRHSRLFARG